MEDRAELASQQPGPLKESVKSSFGAAQFPEMSDSTRGFQGINQLRGALFSPTHEGLLRRQSIEGVVDLDGGEVTIIVSKPPARRHVDGVEEATPMVIAPTRGADEEPGFFHSPALQALDKKPRKSLETYPRGKNPTGLRFTPPCRISKWRWGPVDRPVLPIKPMTCPCCTPCPAMTRISLRWAYRVSKPLP